MNQLNQLMKCIYLLSITCFLGFLGFIYCVCVCVFFVAISNPRNLTMVFKAPFDLHRRPWPRALSSFRKGHQVQYSSASMHPECRLSLARGFHHANRECRFLYNAIFWSRKQRNRDFEYVEMATAKKALETFRKASYKLVSSHL